MLMTMIVVCVVYTDLKRFYYCAAAAAAAAAAAVNEPVKRSRKSINLSYFEMFGKNTEFKV